MHMAWTGLWGPIGTVVLWEGAWGLYCYESSVKFTCKRSLCIETTFPSGSWPGQTCTWQWTGLKVPYGLWSCGIRFSQGMAGQSLGTHLLRPPKRAKVWAQKKVSVSNLLPYTIISYHFIFLFICIFILASVIHFLIKRSTIFLWRAQKWSDCSEIWFAYSRISYHHLCQSIFS